MVETLGNLVDDRDPVPEVEVPTATVPRRGREQFRAR